MFGYLRYFSVISIIIVALSAYFAGAYFRSMAINDLEEMVSKNSKTLVQGYINSVWKEYRSDLAVLYRIDISKWRDHKKFWKFEKATIDYFQEESIVGLTLYTERGDIILTSEATKPALHDAEWTEQFKTANKGVMVSNILEDRTYYLKNGEGEQGSIIRTFAPISLSKQIIHSNGSGLPKVESIIEVHYNVTAQQKKLRNFQLIAMGSIILILLVLIAVLMLFARRTEYIISKQHEINLELTAAAASAEAENRDKSQFLANISHELRTPLNAIIGFSEIIKSENDTNISDQHKEYIKDIHGSGVHLLSLINDILDFSKAEAGKLELSVAELDMVKLVKNSMRLVIPRAEQAQITLAEELPSKHFVVQTDAKKLKQVLLNLLSNSVKFTPAGGQVKVSTWANTDNNTVILKVEDTGIGISPKDISRVLTPFGQVDSALSRNYEGTGLGLPLSKKLVEILGGTFHIESELEKGTAITITLPQIYNHDNDKVNLT